MKTHHLLLPLSLAAALMLVACKPAGDSDDKTAGGDSGTSVRSTMLWGKNVKLTATGYPKAEISPEGDFILDGKAVAVTAAQRTLLVAYHREIGGIAEAGMAAGKEGAKLAGKAVGAAIRGVFSGDPDSIDRQMQAESKKVEAEAMKICERLPGLYKAQQDLAAALPEFKPYASMDLDDVADCRIDQTATHEAGEDVGRAIGQALKDGNAPAGMNAAEEADAAAAAKPESPAP